MADGLEPPSGFWELNPSLLEEQPVLLTTEQSPQSAVADRRVSSVCSVSVMWAIILL